MVFFFVFPSVAVVVASDVFVPLVTVGFVSFGADSTFVVIEAVSTGSAFGDAFFKGWTIVFGELSFSNIFSLRL